MFFFILLGLSFTLEALVSSLLLFHCPLCLVTPLTPPTMSDIEAANALKVQGNKAFAQHEWPAAVEFYTKAIEKYDKEPSYFSNRAQVCDSDSGFGRVAADGWMIKS